MRLFIWAWRAFRDSLGFTPSRGRASPRLAPNGPSFSARAKSARASRKVHATSGRAYKPSVEQLEPIIALSVTTTTLAPQLAPEPPALVAPAIPLPLQADAASGLKGQELLQAKLDAIGAAITVNLAAGEY